MIDILRLVVSGALTCVVVAAALPAAASPACDGTAPCGRGGSSSRPAPSVAPALRPDNSEAYRELGGAIGNLLGRAIESAREPPEPRQPTVDELRQSAAERYRSEISSARSERDCDDIPDRIAKALCREKFAGSVTKRLDSEFDSIASGRKASGFVDLDGKASKDKGFVDVGGGKQSSVDAKSGLSARQCVSASAARAKLVQTGDTRNCEFQLGERCARYEGTWTLENGCSRSVRVVYTWSGQHTTMVPPGSSATQYCFGEPGRNCVDAPAPISYEY